MNWDAISFDWNQVRAFLATAEEGSLSAAARALRQTQPTISRQVSALEASLGVTLFERGPRHMALTDTGHSLLEQVRIMADAATQMSLKATGQSEEVSGKVVITSTTSVATLYLPRVLLALRDRAPKLMVEVVTANEVKDLTRREADIAIRHTRPEQADLIAKLVEESPASLYASDAFFKAHGQPGCLEDLSDLPLIGFGPISEVAAAYAGIGVTVRPENIVVTTRSGPAIVAFAKAGLGMTLMTHDMVSAIPGFRKVLPDLPDIPVPVWLVTHRELHTSPRIRLVFDALADVFAQNSKSQ